MQSRAVRYPEVWSCGLLSTFSSEYPPPGIRLSQRGDAESALWDEGLHSWVLPCGGVCWSPGGRAQAEGWDVPPHSGDWQGQEKIITETLFYPWKEQQGGQPSARSRLRAALGDERSARVQGKVRTGAVLSPESYNTASRASIPSPHLGLR